MLGLMRPACTHRHKSIPAYDFRTLWTMSKLCSAVCWGVTLTSIMSTTEEHASEEAVRG